MQVLLGFNHLQNSFTENLRYSSNKWFGGYTITQIEQYSPPFWLNIQQNHLSFTKVSEGFLICPWLILNLRHPAGYVLHIILCSRKFTHIVVLCCPDVRSGCWCARDEAPVAIARIFFDQRRMERPTSGKQDFSSLSSFNQRNGWFYHSNFRCSTNQNGLIVTPKGAPFRWMTRCKSLGDFTKMGLLGSHGPTDRETHNPDVLVPQRNVAYPIYKWITMVINHLLSGMIHQRGGLAQKNRPSNWVILIPLANLPWQWENMENPLYQWKFSWENYQ